MCTDSKCVSLGVMHCSRVWWCPTIIMRTVEPASSNLWTSTKKRSPRPAHRVYTQLWRMHIIRIYNIFSGNYKVERTLANKPEVHTHTRSANYILTNMAQKKYRFNDPPTNPPCVWTRTIWALLSGSWSGRANDPKFTIIMIRNLPHQPAPWISITPRLFRLIFGKGKHTYIPYHTLFKRQSREIQQRGHAFTGRLRATDWKSPWKTDFKWFTCHYHYHHFMRVCLMCVYATYASSHIAYGTSTHRTHKHGLHVWTEINNKRTHKRKKPNRLHIFMYEKSVFHHRDMEQLNNKKNANPPVKHRKIQPLEPV